MSESTLPHTTTASAAPRVFSPALCQRCHRPCRTVFFVKGKPRCASCCTLQTLVSLPDSSPKAKLRQLSQRLRRLFDKSV